MRALACVAACLLTLALPATAPAGEASNQVVLVLNFEPVSAEAGFGAAVSEVFRVAFAKAADGRYRIVERSSLNRVLKEQERSLSDAVDADTAVEVGKLLSARFLVEGSVTKLGGTFVVNARLVDVESGETRRADSVQSSQEAALVNELRALARKLVGEQAKSAAKPVAVATAPAAQARIQGHYRSQYKDAQGVHGSDIYLTQDGSSVHGIDILQSTGGEAKVWGTLEGDQLVGVYRASYGYGNFEFRVGDGGKRLDGSYYQVSNGQKGFWRAERVGDETKPKPAPKLQGAGDLTQFRVGQWVLANWKQDAYWYGAEIKALEGAQARVVYLDGTVEMLPASRLRKDDLRAGQRVEVDWKGGGKYWSAVITARRGKAVDVRYGDGSTEKTQVGRVRLR